ncbi:MAG: hypothetical protein MJ182_10010, partial [Treponema sp.]|nr:hypothetical protein [Treponema sp.]
MNKKSEFVKNQFQYLLLQLEVNQLNLLLESYSEILLFFARYSFLFENSSESINSCTADTAQFLVPQAFGERPVKFLDPDGLVPRKPTPTMGI